MRCAAESCKTVARVVRFLLHTRLCLAVVLLAVACARPVKAEDAPAPRSLDVPAPPAIKLRFGPGPIAAPVPPPPAPTGLSPTWFWIAASTTIITASIGGFEALHVKDLYDQANGLPAVSPERTGIHDSMVRAETAADVLLFGSLALAIGTAILAFHVDWSGQSYTGDRVAKLQPEAAGRRWW